MPDAIVLVENEITTGGKYDFWKDITGVQYHYPNQYKNRVRPGTPFVYYRGSQRTSGLRGTPEYFGHGVIGDVWKDPETPGSRPYWYASIQDYTPFPTPVPYRRGDATFYEPPPGDSGNQYFGVGVRVLPEATYQAILSAAGLPPSSPRTAAALPAIEGQHVTLLSTEDGTLLVMSGPRRGGSQDSSSGGRSSRAAAIGRHSEGLVMKRLQEEGRNPRWVSDEGETPGWDIEYTDGAVRIAVEVKATTGDRFTTVELTANEWRAAQEEGVKYHLYLVARCTTPEPVVEILVNPAQMVSAGELSAVPASWAIRRV